MQTIVKSNKTNQITTKKKKKYKKKGNDTKEKLLPQADSDEEADKLPLSATNSSTAAAQVVKVIGRFQTFCQVTIRVTSGCPEDYYYILLF